NAHPTAGAELLRLASAGRFPVYAHLPAVAPPNIDEFMAEMAKLDDGAHPYIKAFFDLNLGWNTHFKYPSYPEDTPAADVRKGRRPAFYPTDVMAGITAL